MKYVPSRRTSLALQVALVSLLAACSDEIVYRDRPTFETPPAGAADFLGYSNAATKRTTCGNCHVGKQGFWENTAHAGAWTTLQASGVADTECEACHSVSSRGNRIDAENVGWVATQNDRYKDVQCESCHGPGLNHVLNPEIAGNRPLATIAVQTDLTRGCGECHSGQHRPFAEEWSKSRHAKLGDEHRNTDPECTSCHEAKGVLASWGVKSTFLETDSTDLHVMITCAVCHDPHDARHTGQLRFPMDVPDVETNLCMRCHHKRAQPELSNRSPHSPQGPVLLGEAGWFPPNFEFPPKSLVGSHGSDRNPRLCATCHVNNYVVNDPLTGAFTFRATGHSFKSIPCVDASGIPLPEPWPAECTDLTKRSFKACVGCHLTEDAARTALSVARFRLSSLAAEVDALYAQVPSSEKVANDLKITTAEGARFNSQLATQPGTAAHNPFLAEALLLGSIRQLKADYGLAVSAGLSLRPQLAPR
jgi:predicted CXXCH cytochrome family protein